MTIEVFYLTAAAVCFVAAVAAYMLGRRSMRSEVESERRHHAGQMAMLKDSFDQQLAALRQMNKEQIEAQVKMIREQMVATSEEVLKARQAELGEVNVEQVSKIIDPLQKSLKDMREALDDSKEKHQEALHKLDATIQANMRSSADLNETAEKLSRALTGEVKVQGNFGELKLKQLLEDLGLKDGEQYSSQEHLRDRFGYKIKDEEGRDMIPDFILHFPDHRDVIVDSKMSFTAFERYINTEDPHEKTRFLKDHLASVRAQVDRLAKKDYSRFLSDGYSKLNFVIMYIHTEGALNLALLNDTSLWREAYDKGVLILGPQTMYMNLRILELMWTQMRQLENQEEMIRHANLIVERTQDFAARFRAVEKSMHEVVEGMEKLKITTADSGPGIITAARNLIKAGARENKKKKTLLMAVTAFLMFAPMSSYAQKKEPAGPEAIYRPVYGYVIDTCTNMPMQNVLVYGFDSMDDAELGRKAVEARRNPMKIKLQGDVVETLTDESGRYMLPALSHGALLFHIKDRNLTVIEEINGRNTVSLGRKEKEPEFDYVDFDLEEYAEKAYRRTQGRNNSGVSLDLNFKCYIPMPGKAAASSRLIVERRVVDLESGAVLSRSVPVVRDGKDYHRMARKMMSKGERKDSLYEIAGNFKALSDTTFAVPVKDHFDSEPWKERCFRLGYFVMMDNGGEISNVDTLYMMINRVSKPLQYLENDFDPYAMKAPEEAVRSRRAVNRRLVLQGKYDGHVPEVLKDSSYILTEMHVKTKVLPLATYEESMNAADGQVKAAMADLRSKLASKMDENVRVTMTSEIDEGLSEPFSTEYRLILKTDRRFSPDEYARLFRKAKDDEELEGLCLRALEESRILEKRSWDYAANVLASLYVRTDRADTSVLAPFIDISLAGCDVPVTDPSTDEDVMMNRREVVANQVISCIRVRDFDRALEYASILPEDFRFLSETAACMAGKAPSGPGAIEILSSFSPRNEAVMDMYTGDVDETTLAAIERMDDGDAMKWYLKARHMFLVNRYEDAKDCLRACFGLDSGMVTNAVMDSCIDEYSLKEVLGVNIL